MAEYIECEADTLKYYVVRNTATGEYYRGKGMNKWGKYYNQSSIYRLKKHAENAVKDLAIRKTQAEVVEIRILENPTDLEDVIHCKDCMFARFVDEREPKWKCVNISRDGCTQWLGSDDYCSYGERKE